MSRTMIIDDKSAEPNSESKGYETFDFEFEEIWREYILNDNSDPELEAKAMKALSDRIESRFKRYVSQRSAA